jgi:nickel-dependent lactate racemase
MRIRLPELLWYEKASVEIELPDDWEVETCPMRGARAPALRMEQMADAIRSPLGAPPLRELARGRKRACILFDDMTRPTRIDQLGPIVVRELLEAGFDPKDITFVCALGSHGALSQVELRKKVGSEILERFRVYNHNCYENCVEVGKTTRGTPLKINREVMEADLKIGLGCVTAHAQVGFSGGGKIVLPGVAHIDSIAHYHLDVQRSAPETTGLGRFDENVMRFNIEEAARMAGLDFKVDVLVNELGEATHVIAGDFLEAHAQAVAIAKDHYATEPRPRGKQVMICNAFCKPNEMPIAYLMGILGLEKGSGSVVIIANAPEGQVVHYMVGRFGTGYGGRQYPIAPLMPGVQLIIQAPHFDRTFGDWFSNPEEIAFTRSWSETRALLEKEHGSGTRAAVLPSATMSYYAG